MSTTTNRNTYSFSFFLTLGDNTEDGFLKLTSDVGLTDDLALALVEAFQSLSWPTGATATAYVEKFATSETQFEGNFTTSPPSFT